MKVIVNVEKNVLDKNMLTLEEMENMVNLYLSRYLETKDIYIPIFDNGNSLLVLTKLEKTLDEIRITVYDVIRTSGVRNKRGFIIQD